MYTKLIKGMKVLKTFYIILLQQEELRGLHFFMRDSISFDTFRFHLSLVIMFYSFASLKTNMNKEIYILVL